MFAHVMAGPFVLACFLATDAEKEAPPQADVTAAAADAKATHQPEALLRIRAQTPTLLASTSVTATSDQDFNVFKNTQASLLKSNFVIQAALRRPKLKALPLIQKHRDDLIDWVQQNMTVDYPGDAEIMRIRFAEGSQEEQATILNAVAETYITEIVDAERQETAASRDILEKALKKAKEELRTKSETLYRLRQDLNQGESSEVSKQLLMKRLNALSDRRIKLDDQLFELKLQVELTAVEQKEILKMQMSSVGNPELQQKFEVRIKEIDKTSENATPMQELYQRKLAELDESIQGILSELSSHAKYSAEVEMRERELAALNEHLNKLEEQVRRQTIDLEAPPRTVFIENASAN
jgi:hypothetical protein